MTIIAKQINVGFARESGQFENCLGFKDLLEGMIGHKKKRNETFTYEPQAIIR